ncbi:MAG: ATP-binding cassette domain-containing protein [Acidimicrobiia bacterium]|nr:ATP-binding cassette domain-containing protein [Acidimicrobiia bacterium]
MLRLDGLHKRFGEVVALDDCTLTVGAGQMLGFLGPNGAGKTTAMRTIFGLVRPDRGRVTWDDRQLTTAVRRRIGYMPEERGLYPKMRVRKQLVYFGRLHGLDRETAEQAADRWLERFDLTDRADAKVVELSHGNQQRVQLAASLAHNPMLLVLDEPFAGLDPIAVVTMAGILREQAERGIAVLFSSHQLDLVEDLCDDVAIIDAGRVILAGRVSQLRSASPRRYLEIATSRPVDPSWITRLPGASLVEHRNDRIRLLVGEEADLQTLAAAAAQAGEITSFTLEPPRLSEIFTAAVGR